MAGFKTKAIHVGQEPEQVTGAVAVPVFQTSTYAQQELGRHAPFDYARTINPTRVALEKNLAALENGQYGFSFASGMAAIAGALSLVKNGDHVVAGSDMYGGSYRYFSRILAENGVEFSYVDMRNSKNVEAAIKSNTKLIYCETPTNPMMNLVDLKEVSAIAKAKKLISVVDNTFMSPYFQNPLDMGIDIVLHSATKYIGGHSDVIGGAVITSNPELAERIKFYQNSAGAVPGPWDVWLLLRSVKTLALRMEAHNANAIQIAEYLSKQKKIAKVFYPGLASHPQHELAKRQMRGFGGIISIETGSQESAKRFTSRLTVFTLGESLGGVESLVCHPVTMTHGSVPPERRAELGITGGLIRLSVGIEDIADLMEDINRGLDAI
ncbi:MAG: PLP-dependent aspartate aminotransferase family protein [Bacteroidota bacterium]|nr:PLP-dependent aspartate aminotransferase family protein [Bacteroidota bacterium]MDP4228941.1 PLP-dependent aspartate aminotransferase family protein [Bacteroidota bacterium]